MWGVTLCTHVRSGPRTSFACLTMGYSARWTTGKSGHCLGLRRSYFSGASRCLKGPEPWMHLVAQSSQFHIPQSIYPWFFKTPPLDNQVVWTSNPRGDIPNTMAMEHHNGLVWSYHGGFQELACFTPSLVSLPDCIAYLWTWGKRDNNLPDLRQDDLKGMLQLGTYSEWLSHFLDG